MSDKFHLPHFLSNAFLSLLFVAFSIFNLPSLPVSAIEDNTTSAETTTETEAESSTESNADTDTNTTTDTDTDDSTFVITTDEQGATTVTAKKSNNNCTNQTGAIGWLICPTVGVIANATDALYSIIGNFLVIDPVSFNQDSPVFNIWDYCRSITNIIFAIIILVIIFSQVTGLGLSNYNLKKTLPRVIVSAILINLSFILCSLAVDLSNIIGANLTGFFNGITESTIASTGYDPETYQLANIATAIIGGGTIGGITIAVIATGGIAAFFWMLVPILLGAIVSVASGILTISARQAVVVILVMIAPLAIIASALPNTEKWFTKWKSIFIQMLVFYPIFSLLFGASRLLGIIFVTSATNPYGIILGVAVQVFPLFFSWKLMKMSGTVLGSLNSALAGLGQRGVAGSRNWAASHQAVAKAKHNATSNLPSARLVRYLEDRKARRDSDLATYNEAAKLRQERFSANVYNRRGQLTRRGESLYRMTGENLNNTAEAKRLRAELGEAGYRDDGSDKRIRSGAQQQRIAKINKNIVKGVDLNHASDSFVESAKTANSASYADRTEQIREQVIAIRNNEQLSETEKMDQIAALDSNIRNTLASITDPQARTQYMNNIFANAISAQAKADKTIHDNYAQLYAATKLTRNIHADFNKSFADSNYNALEAAIDELAKRGDFDLIKESLEQHSGEIVDNVEMQKHLSDTLIKYKADSAPLWAYAKAINIRRAKHAKDPEHIALFPTFEEFESGVVPQGYTEEAEGVTDALSMSTLIGDINNPAIAVSQDRTTFKYILQSQRDGFLKADQLGFKIKQLRSAASSGQIDGEQLGNLNMLLTGGMKFDKAGNMTLDPNSADKKERAAYAYIVNNGQQIKANILDYLSNMAAGQLANMKESTFLSLNNALTFLDNMNADGSTPHGAAGRDYSIIKDKNNPLLAQSFYDALYKNAASNMNNILKSNMNTNIKNWLGIQNNRQ